MNKYSLKHKKKAFSLLLLLTICLFTFTSTFQSWMIQQILNYYCFKSTYGQGSLSVATLQQQGPGVWQLRQIQMQLQNQLSIHCDSMEFSYDPWKPWAFKMTPETATIHYPDGTESAIDFKIGDGGNRGFISIASNDTEARFSDLPLLSISWEHNQPSEAAGPDCVMHLHILSKGDICTALWTLGIEELPYEILSGEVEGIISWTHGVGGGSLHLHNFQVKQYPVDLCWVLPSVDCEFTDVTLSERSFCMKNAEIRGDVLTAQTEAASSQKGVTLYAKGEITGAWNQSKKELKIDSHDAEIVGSQFLLKTAITPSRCCCVIPFDAKFTEPLCILELDGVDLVFNPTHTQVQGLNGTLQLFEDHWKMGSLTDSPCREELKWLGRISQGSVIWKDEATYLDDLSLCFTYDLSQDTLEVTNLTSTLKAPFLSNGDKMHVNLHSLCVKELSRSPYGEFSLGCTNSQVEWAMIQGSLTANPQGNLKLQLTPSTCSYCGPINIIAGNALFNPSGSLVSSHVTLNSTLGDYAETFNLLENSLCTEFVNAYLHPAMAFISTQDNTLQIMTHIDLEPEKRASIEFTVDCYTTEHKSLCSFVSSYDGLVWNLDDFKLGPLEATASIKKDGDLWRLYLLGIHFADRSLLCVEGTYHPSTYQFTGYVPLCELQLGDINRYFQLLPDTDLTGFFKGSGSFSLSGSALGKKWVAQTHIQGQTIDFHSHYIPKALGDTAHLPTTILFDSDNELHIALDLPQCVIPLKLISKSPIERLDSGILEIHSLLESTSDPLKVTWEQSNHQISVMSICGSFAEFRVDLHSAPNQPHALYGTIASGPTLYHISSFEICCDPTQVILSNVQLANESTQISIEEFAIKENLSEKRNDFFIKNLTGSELCTPPLQIQKLHIPEIEGSLNDPFTSMQGHGSMTCSWGKASSVNSLRSLFEETKDISSRPVDSSDVLAGISGEIIFSIADNKVIFNEFKHLYNANKTAQWNLVQTPEEQSYISFDGDMHVNVKVKHRGGLLNKVIEQLTLTLEGDLHNPTCTVTQKR